LSRRFEILGLQIRGKSRPIQAKRPGCGPNPGHFDPDPGQSGANHSSRASANGCSWRVPQLPVIPASPALSRRYRLRQSEGKISQNSGQGVHLSVPTSLTTESQVFDCHVDNTRNEAKALYMSSKLGTPRQTPKRGAPEGSALVGLPD
jgi:hypothetical protein